MAHILDLVRHGTLEQLDAALAAPTSADLAFEDGSGRTALSLAISRTNLDMVTRLVKAGFDPNHIQGAAMLQAVILSSKSGSSGSSGGYSTADVIVSYLATVGSGDPSLKDSVGRTPLGASHGRMKEFLTLVANNTSKLCAWRNGARLVGLSSTFRNKFFDVDFVTTQSVGRRLSILKKVDKAPPPSAGSTVSATRPPVQAVVIAPGAEAPGTSSFPEVRLFGAEDFASLDRLVGAAHSSLLAVSPARRPVQALNNWLELSEASERLLTSRLLSTLQAGEAPALIKTQRDPLAQLKTKSGAPWREAALLRCLGLLSCGKAFLTNAKDSLNTYCSSLWQTQSGAPFGAEAGSGVGAGAGVGTGAGSGAGAGAGAAPSPLSSTPGLRSATCRHVHDNPVLWSPLVLLAASRVHRMNDDIIQAWDFLLLFKTLASDADSWLVPGEQGPRPSLAPKRRGGADDDLEPEELWDDIKMEDGVVCEAMDKLMQLTGLRRVKMEVLARYKLLKREADLPDVSRTFTGNLNILLTGNPGTGKTTVAEYLGSILHAIGVRTTNKFVHTDAAKLKAKGGKAFEEKDLDEAKGGVLFIDEAHQLDPVSGDPRGKEIADRLLTAGLRKDITIILAGYKEDIRDKLLAYDPGLPSRFHVTIHFDDFTEAELTDIWESALAKKKYSVESHSVTKTAVRRVHAGAGNRGFGNARAMDNMFRHHAVPALARRLKKATDPLVLTMEDIIGPPPSREKNPRLDAALTKLETMVGQPQIKDTIKDVVQVAFDNYQLEAAGEKPTPLVLNKLLIGNPGTGKTTVARLYGEILASIGLLSKSDVLERTASDFIGSAVGESAKTTISLIEEARGGVLMIDEAYVLDEADGRFGPEVLNTIVEKVHGAPGDDIAVLMLGYKDEMDKMMRDQNPGLKRRFNSDNPMVFLDYTDEELLEILNLMAASKGYLVPLDVSKVAVERLGQKRQQKHFGNAGEVNNLLTGAIQACAARRGGKRLTHADFASAFGDTPRDGGGDSGTGPTMSDPLASLDGLYGLESLKTEMQELVDFVYVAREEGDEPPVADHIVLLGSSGTGKSTVAKRLNKMYHALGLLAMPGPTVVVSADELGGQYIGQAQANVRKRMEEALGRVLLIDEAYKLGAGQYGSQVMDSIIALTTDEQFDGKIVVILAGYPDEMYDMEQRNPGMTSRFPQRVVLPDWTPGKCVGLIEQQASKERFDLEKGTESVLERAFAEMKTLPGWGNARDAVTIYKAVKRARATRVAKVRESKRTFTVTDVTVCTEKVLKTRRPPKSMGGCRRRVLDDGLAAPPRGLEPPPPPKVEAKVHTKTKHPPAEDDPWGEEEDGDGEEQGEAEAKVEVKDPDDPPTVPPGSDSCGCDSLRDRLEAVLGTLNLTQKQGLDLLKTPFATNPRLRDGVKHVMGWSEAELQAYYDEQKAEFDAQQAALLEALRAADKAEQDRLAAEEAERVRQEQEEARRAEKARLEAEALAQAQREAAAAAAEAKRLRLELEEALRRARELEDERLRKLAEEAAERLRIEQAEREAEAERRRIEAERLAELERQREAERQRRELEWQRLEATRVAAVLEEQRKQEVLRRIGNCPAGYTWIKQGDGSYRCWAGGHRVSAAQIQSYMY